MQEQGKQAKEEFKRNGICIAEWSREKGFPANLVYDILSGRKRCIRGKSHKIAVALGIKSIT